MDTRSPLQYHLPTMMPTVLGQSTTPTYTTVGSIYNPQAATPLQPPARRGRSCRYPPPYQSPTGTAGALSLSGSLSALSANETGTATSPMGGNNTQKYSPLQQNYDRAVNPTPDQASGLRMNPPGIRDEAVFPPPAFPASAAASADRRENPNSAGINAIDPEDALTSQFSVKTLTNLASYPNPMQKKAQKALAKGRTANLDNRTNTPASPVYHPSDIGNGRSVPSPPGLHRRNPSDPTLVNIPHIESRRGVGPSGVARFPASGVCVQAGRGTQQGWAGYKTGGCGCGTLSTSAGAPPPLTAGPPGQRQYKPSTFEGTLKALHGNSHRARNKSQARLVEYPPASASSHPAPATNKNSLATGGPSPSPADGSIHLGYLSIAELESEPCAHPGLGGTPTPGGDQAAHKIKETLSLEAAQKYFSNGFPSNYVGRSKPIESLWFEEYPLGRQTPRSLTAEELARRQRKVDRAFYAGTGWLGKSMDDAFQELLRRRSEATVGSMGQEQRYTTRRNTSAGDNGMVTYPPMNVPGVGAQGLPVHAGRFLNMAFATFLSYAEEYDKDPDERGWRSGFETPDAHLIDDTDEGNRSFFEEIKNPFEAPDARLIDDIDEGDTSFFEEIKKPRRVARRARLGY